MEVAAGSGLWPSVLAEAPGIGVGVATNTVAMLIGNKLLRKGLDTSGIMNAWLLGAAVYSAFGYRGYAIMVVYFGAGTAVTKLKLAQKQREGTAEANSGLRSWRSVWGSGIAAFACAILSIFAGGSSWANAGTVSAACKAGFLASMASKLGDTASSEVGKAYGKTTYLITTMQRVPRGTEGAVSLEGTAAGVAAGAAMILLGSVLGMVRRERTSAAIRNSDIAFLSSVLSRLSPSASYLHSARRLIVL